MKNTTIVNSTSSPQKVFINYYNIFKDWSKFTDEDAAALSIDNVFNRKDLTNLFEQNVIIGNFNCTIIKKIKRDNKKDSLKVLLRFNNLSRIQNMLEENSFLSTIGILDVETGIINLERFFISSLSKEPLPFEVSAEGFEIVVQQNLDKKTAIQETFFNTSNLSKLKFLKDKFENIKKQWEEYLDFQKNILKENQNKAQFIFNINEDLKSWNKNKKEHYVEFYALVNKKDHFENWNLSEISICNININENFKNNKLDLEEPFAFNSKYINNKDDKWVNLQVLISKERVSEEEKIILVEELIKNTETIKRWSQIHISINLDDLHSFNIFKLRYTTEEEPSSVINNNIGSFGYLGFMGVGDNILIRRSEVVLNKIFENDVANPYLMLYIFNSSSINLLEYSKWKENEIKWFSNDLNAEQKKAVYKSLNSNDVFLIQGPPGTGKTQVITEIINQLTMRNKKVLLSSQNHTSIDNVFERLGFNPSIFPIRLYNKGVGRKDNTSKYNSPEYLIYNSYKNIYKFLINKMNADIKLKFESQDRIIKNLNNNISDLYILLRNLNNFHAMTKELNTINNKKEDIVLKINNQVDSVQESRIEINNLENFVSFLKGDENLTFKETSTINKIFFMSIGFLMQKFLELENFSSVKETHHFLKKQLDLNSSKINKEIKAIDKEILNYEKDKTITADHEACTKTLVDLKAKKIKLQNKISSTNIIRYQDIVAKIVEKTELEIKKLNDTKGSPHTDRLKLEKEELDYNYKKTNHNLKKEKLNILHQIDQINKEVDEKNKLTESCDSQDCKDLINILQSKLSKIEETNKQDQHNFKSKEFFIKNTIKFLEENYDISLYNESDPLSNIRLKEETKQLINLFLDTSVNLVGLTATASQQYLQNQNSNFKEFNISDINVKDFKFDYVIIDEISKLTPMEIFMPLVYGKSVIMVGDYRQLPPIFKYQKKDVAQICEKYNQNYNFSTFEELFSKSLFKEIITKANSSAKMILTKQYRSHGDIMKIVNVFYDNELELGLSNQNIIKSHSIHFTNSEKEPIFTKDKAIYWINSHYNDEGEVVYDSSQEGSTSMFNANEVKIVSRTLEIINESYGVNANLETKPTVGIISFYSLHIRKIKESIRKMNLKNINFKISTVDDFQGKEVDIAIVSTIRNPKNPLNANLDFLKKYERINVAFSRARKALIIVGSINMMVHLDVPIPEITDPSKIKLEKPYFKIKTIVEEYGRIIDPKELK